jgi:hypothetical protein
MARIEQLIGREVPLAKVPAELGEVPEYRPKERRPSSGKPEKSKQQPRNKPKPSQQPARPTPAPAPQARTPIKLEKRTSSPQSNEGTKD